MSTDPHHIEKQLARQGRLIALVIAGTTLLWMAAQWDRCVNGPEPAGSVPIRSRRNGRVYLGTVVGLQIWRKRRES